MNGLCRTGAGPWHRCVPVAREWLQKQLWFHLCLFAKTKWDISGDGFIHCLMFSKAVLNQTTNVDFSWSCCTSLELCCGGCPRTCPNVLSLPVSSCRMKEGFVEVFWLHVFNTYTRITKAFRKCDFLVIQTNCR